MVSNGVWKVSATSESGMSTICVYDDLGSEVFVTIKDGFCPL